MTWEFIGQCALGAIVIAGWFGALYCACNRDYQRKLRAEREAQLAALSQESVHVARLDETA